MKKAVLILAGGKGERLWPVSRMNWPKFFLNIRGGNSLFQDVFLRGRRIAGPNTFVVANREHRYLLKDDLKHKEIFCPLENIIAEPQGKNTAPAIALGIRRILAAGHDPVVFIFPADHLIPDKSKFFRAINKAASLAQKGQIITLGIKPAKPKTGYGYIKVSRKNYIGAYRVAEFVEKPSLARAKSYIKAGRYYWNSGIFIGKASVIWQELTRYKPAITRSLARWDGKNLKALKRIYPKLPDISFDYAVMEKTRKALLVPFSGRWSDLGDWESVHEALAKGRHAFKGKVISIDSKNNLVFSTAKRLIVTLGVEDLRIIDTEDALLILKPGYAQKIKEVVGLLKGSDILAVHPTVRRPWGSYTVLEHKDDYKVKIIEILPGRALSLQRHSRRSEEWIVLKGRVEVELKGRIYQLKAGMRITIPVRSAHRLRNRTRTPVKILELARGRYLKEDDIMRLSDDFQR